MRSLIDPVQKVIWRMEKSESIVECPGVGILTGTFFRGVRSGFAHSHPAVFQGAVEKKYGGTLEEL